jgi:hypothetical protein
MRETRRKTKGQEKSEVKDAGVEKEKGKMVLFIILWMKKQGKKLKDRWGLKCRNGSMG